MSYRIYSGIWHSDKDIFGQACFFDSEVRFLDCDLLMKEKSQIIGAIFDFIGIMSKKNQKKTDVSLNACDEMGRIDFCFSSIDRFKATIPSEHWLEKWEKGEKECFYDCISFYVEKIQVFDCSGLELK
jgi:hypothetical protein